MRPAHTSVGGSRCCPAARCVDASRVWGAAGTNGHARGARRHGCAPLPRPAGRRASAFAHPQLQIICPATWLARHPLPGRQVGRPAGRWVGRGTISLLSLTDCLMDCWLLVACVAAAGAARRGPHPFHPRAAGAARRRRAAGRPVLARVGRGTARARQSSRSRKSRFAHFPLRRSAKRAAGRKPRVHPTAAAPSNKIL